MTIEAPIGRATDRRGELAGSALAALMGVLFSFVVIFGKSLLAPGKEPFAVLAIRYGASALGLAVLLIATKRPLLPAPGEWLGMFLAGVLGYGTESAFYFAALGHGNAAAVTLLFYTYPVIVMVATIAMDRRTPAKTLVFALALAVGGSAIVAVGGSGVEIETAGIVLALCSATAYSSYLIGADRVLRRTDPMTAAMWLAAGAAVSTSMFAVVFGRNVIPHGGDWWKVVGMAAFTIGAFTAMLGSLQRVGAVRNAIISVIEPVAVALLAWLFLSEPITWTTGVGGGMILAAAILATLVRTTRITEPNL